MTNNNKIITIKAMESMRDRVLFTYFKALQMAKKPINNDVQELASQVWDDMFDLVLSNNGDIGLLLEAGLEVIIDNAIEDYAKRGVK